MKLFSIVALAAATIAVASAEPCDLSKFGTLFGNSDIQTCKTDTNFFIANPFIPTGDALTKFCASTACQNELAAVKSLNLGDCTVANFRLTTDVLTSLSSACGARNNQPGNNQPANNQPGNNQPGNNQPGNNQPGNNQPGNNQPANNQPANNQPANNQPANNPPAGGLPVGGVPVGGAPTSNPPAGGAPADTVACDTTKFTPLLSNSDVTQCKIDSDFVITAAIIPTGGALNKFCTSPACQKELATVKALNLGDCTVLGKRLETELLTPLAAACKNTTSDTIGSESTANNSTANNSTANNSTANNSTANNSIAASNITLPSPVPTPTAIGTTITPTPSSNSDASPTPSTMPNAAATTSPAPSTGPTPSPTSAAASVGVTTVSVAVIIALATAFL